MKVFEKIDTAKMHEAWQNRFNLEVSFYGGKEVAFSPAVQAQTSPYGQIALGEMPAYYMLHGVFMPYEYTGWLDECQSIATTCFIGDWSWLEKLRLTGPDAVKCLEASTINGYKKFAIGRGRHICSVTPEGKLIGDGIAFREGENEFFLSGGLTMKDGQMIRTEGLDVQLETLTDKVYNFHVQGPDSQKVIEKACGEDISDIAFITFRNVMIAGKTVRVYRGGMSGEHGYELFGDSAEGSVIWQALLEAGKEFGMRQFGHRSLMENHLQAFFPTIWVDFVPAIMPPEAHLDQFYRSPVDFGWGGLIDKTRDFPGKSILMEEMEHPTHKTMMLEWNSEDVISVYASLFEEGTEAYEQIPMPTNTSEPGGGASMVAPVFNQERQIVGWASNRGYSAQFKKMISITYLDIKYAEPGTELFVGHGGEGKRQTMIRATVVEAPYKNDVRRAK